MDVHDFCGWAMSQKLPVHSFKWVGNTSHFSKSFIIDYNEESDEGCFIKNYKKLWKIVWPLQWLTIFTPKSGKWKTCSKLAWYEHMNMLYT